MPDQQPSIGRIVIYRSRSDVDMAAIVTGLGPVDDDGVQRLAHLQVFPPPGEATELMDREWGVAQSDKPLPGRWRWPERVEGGAKRA